MKVKDRYIDFIKKVTAWPGMYQINKVEDIWLVSLGYQQALQESENVEVGNFLVAFRAYVNEHFNSKENHGWERLIRLYSGSDSHSIELFVQLFSQYVDETIGLA
jgi:hypothetical protein